MREGKYVEIYLDETKKNRLVIRPTAAFSGDWEGLVYAATYSVKGEVKRFHSYQVI